MKLIEEVIGPCRLICGDSLEAMASLGDGVVDCVVTDPPYSTGGTFRSDRAVSTVNKYTLTGTDKQYHEFSGDNRDQRGWSAWSMIWLGKAADVTRVGGYLAMFVDWRQLPTATDVIQGGGWSWRGVIPWNKTEAARPQRGWFRAQCEYVITASLGSLGAEQERACSDCLAGLWTEPVIGATKLHPTEKPVALMEWLLTPCMPPEGSTRRVGVVLDPFMGSGTTAEAESDEDENPTEPESPNEDEPPQESGQPPDDFRDMEVNVIPQLLASSRPNEEIRGGANGTDTYHKAISPTELEMFKNRVEQFLKAAKRATYTQILQACNLSAGQFAVVLKVASIEKNEEGYYVPKRMFR